MNASKLCHALKHCLGHEFGWEIIGDLIRWERMKALIFDLDGTLVDSVYAHVLAWQVAFAEAGMPIDGWRLHRRMGMSGGLFKRAVMRELGRTISLPKLQALDKRHGELFHKFLPHPRPLPGAVQLLRFLRKNRVIHGVATSNQRPHINSSLKALGISEVSVRQWTHALAEGLDIRKVEQRYQMHCIHDIQPRVLRCRHPASTCQPMYDN